MEGKENLQSSGVMKGEEVPDTYRSENPGQFSETTTPLALAPAVAPVAGTALAAAVAPAVVAPPAIAAPPATPVSGVAPGTEVKRKRGRPRKYGPDGKGVVALSPMPISASIPLTGDYSTWKHSKGQPMDSYKKKHKSELIPGKLVEYSVGAKFTPHVIIVNAGEVFLLCIHTQITIFGQRCKNVSDV